MPESAQPLFACLSLPPDDHPPLFCARLIELIAWHTCFTFSYVSNRAILSEGTQLARDTSSRHMSSGSERSISITYTKSICTCSSSFGPAGITSANIQNGVGSCGTVGVPTRGVWSRSTIRPSTPISSKTSRKTPLYGSSPSCRCPPGGSHLPNFL